MVNKKPEMMNAFELANQKRPVQSTETKEMSLSQRMARARDGQASSDPDDMPVSLSQRMTRRTAELEAQKPAVAVKPAVTRTSAGTIETPALRQAREAEQARRTALKNQAAGLVHRTEFVPEDFQATMSGWIFINSIENGGTFFLSEWNAQMLSRCVYFQVMSGQPEWTKFGISELDAAHEFLTANGYYETERHHRGQVAPKEFPVWEPPQQKSEPIRTGNGRVFIKRDETSAADARRMDFDTLKKNVQSQFQPEKR